MRLNAPGVTSLRCGKNRGFFKADVETVRLILIDKKDISGILNYIHPIIKTDHEE